MSAPLPIGRRSSRHFTYSRAPTTAAKTLVSTTAWRAIRSPPAKRLPDAEHPSAAVRAASSARLASLSLRFRDHLVRRRDPAPALGAATRYEQPPTSARRATQPSGVSASDVKQELPPGNRRDPAAPGHRTVMLPCSYVLLGLCTCAACVRRHRATFGRSGRRHSGPKTRGVPVVGSDRPRPSRFPRQKQGWPRRQELQTQKSRGRSGPMIIIPAGRTESSRRLAYIRSHRQARTVRECGARHHDRRIRPGLGSRRSKSNKAQRHARRG